jgi:DNA-binding transcriptional LysR family regulator
MLDYKGIEALAFVAREGSFGKAAKALFPVSIVLMP